MVAIVYLLHSFVMGLLPYHVQAGINNESHNNWINTSIIINN